MTPSRCGNSWIGNIRNHSGFQTFVNDRSVALSPAHQKQGPFPPPTLLGLHGCMTLSDFRAGHHPIDDVEGAIFTTPGYPAITQIAFLACRAHYPGGSNRCDCRLLPCPYCLPRLTGGSASTTSLSRPTQASLTLRPARLLARPKADFCPEASTRPVTRPSRSVATMLIDVYMDGSSPHWRSAPLRRTVNYTVGRFVRVPERFRKAPG
jgi:hypothetical protein